MKISIFKGEEGYDNYLAHRTVMVYVNGEPLSNVVRLDTDEGWADFNVKDEDGLFVIVGGNILEDRAEGLVEVTGRGLPLPVEEEEPEVVPEYPEDEEDA